MNNGTALTEVDASLAGLYPPAPAVLPALGEAPASANVRIQIGGREVQVTLRDTDEDRLLARLERLLERYARPEALEPGEGWCSQHHVPMRLNEKHGRQWWSHKTAQGWCKGP